MRSASFAFVALACGVAAQQTQIDASVLTDFTRYAAFASASYSSDCLVPPYGSVAEKFFDVAITSTQGILFRDDAKKEYILSFRGTSNLQDFITDMVQDLVPCDVPGISCLGCTCHKGYIAQYNSVDSEVVAAVKAGLAANDGYSLTVTGHSMGGALASLAAAALQGQGFALVVYTYGQPRTGDQNYADYIDQEFGGQAGTMFRITHSNDGVPQIPSEDDGFRHHLTEYWQSEDTPSPATTYECQGQEPKDCNQSERGTGIGRGGIGINLAHLSYLGISTGNPLNPDAACEGIN